MKLQYTLSLFLILLATLSNFAQSFERLDVPFSERGDTWDLALVGGLNAPQFSNVDLNNDGLQDLYIFDRHGSVHLTFLSDGSKYIFSPEYAKNFPALTNWALLRDYNQDGAMDIFTSVTIPGIDGVEVYRGFYESDMLNFEKILFPDRNFDIIYLAQGQLGQLYNSKVDLPSVDDIDCDGDLDIVAFGVFGGYASYFQNQSVEMGYGLDSLIYILEDNCWGKFYESGLTPEISLSGTEGLCAEERTNTIEQRHAGSTTLTLDLDGDDDKDLLIADISFDNIGALYNGGDCNRAWMNTQDINFPPYDQSAAVTLFSAPYYVDMDFDGIRDLIIAPNDINNSDGREIVWFYKNIGTDDAPTFDLQNKRQLLDRMVDLGAGANPTFVDYNADGLLDIVVGNLGYALPFGERDGRLTLFENVGTPQSPSFQLVDEDYLNFSQYNGQIYDFAPAFGDMDDDGDLDLVVGSHSGVTFYAENMAGPDAPFRFDNIIPNWQGLNPGQHTTPVIIDLNEDGANDLLFGERNGNINFFPNIGSPRTAAFNADHNSSPNLSFVGRIDPRDIGFVTAHSAPAITEVEGELKIIVGTENGKLEMYNMNLQNLSDTFLLDTERLGNIKEGRFTRPAIADINNDGKLDVLVGNIRGGLALYTTNFDSDNTVNTKNFQMPNITIFPNPANEWINIQLEDPSAFERVELFDLNGKLLHAQTIREVNTQIQIADLPPAVYFAKVTGESGTLTRKIIVQ